MASVDTTILSSSDVGEPKPGNPESAGFFANILNLYILYYTPILGFSEIIRYQNGITFQAKKSYLIHDVMMPIV